MISDDKLIAWLVIFRHQSIYGADRVYLPAAVSEALIAKGWMEIDDEPDERGLHPTGFTDAGLLISDHNAAEFGIDIVMQESEA